MLNFFADLIAVKELQQYPALPCCSRRKRPVLSTICFSSRPSTKWLIAALQFLKETIVGRRAIEGNVSETGVTGWDRKSARWGVVWLPYRQQRDHMGGCLLSPHDSVSISLLCGRRRSSRARVWHVERSSPETASSYVYEGSCLNMLLVDTHIFHSHHLTKTWPAGCRPVADSIT